MVEGFGRLEDGEGDAGANPRLRHPTCALLRRHRLACFLLHLRSLTSARLRHLCRLHVLTLSFFLVWVAEQDTAGREGSARVILAEASSHPRTPATKRASLDHGAGIPPELVLK